MEAVFAKVAKVPHVSEVASPYERGGAGGGQRGRQDRLRHGPVRLTTEKLEDGETEEVVETAQDAAGDGLQVELGGQPIEEYRAEEEADISGAVGLLAAIVVLLLTFGSVVAMGLPMVTALFALGVGLSLVTLATHVFPTAEFAPQLAS